MQHSGMQFSTKKLLKYIHTYTTEPKYILKKVYNQNK